MSILGAMAKKLNKKEEDVSIVVAHLGSGGSSCCIRKGKSIDTSKSS
jgi:acetate kinase